MRSQSPFVEAKRGLGGLWRDFGGFKSLDLKPDESYSLSFGNTESSDLKCHASPDQRIGNRLTLCEGLKTGSRQLS